MSFILPFIKHSKEVANKKIDGEIYLDTPVAKEFGFTSDKFREDSYLWRTGNLITISLITSKKERKGYCRTLIETIKEKGYDIFVPSPSTRMVMICEKQGFSYHLMTTGSEDPCEGMYFENKKGEA